MRQLALIGLEPRVVQSIKDDQDYYAQLGRPEYVDVRADEVKATELASDVAAVVVAGHALKEVVTALGGRRAPVLVVLSEYTALRVCEAYEVRDLYSLEGVFSAALASDPEERGLFAQALSDALAAAPQGRPKTIGKWKIDARDAHQERPLLSLLLDRRMQQFMQELKFTAERASQAWPQGFSAPSMRKVGKWWSNLGAAVQKGAELKALEDAAPDLGLRGGPSVRPPAILLEGETGCGKTVVARWLSKRLTPSGEHVQVPLVNVAHTLMETELFGSLAGGFTHAVSRPGQLLLGYGQTVFLDEIGDAPPEIQAKLLVYLDKFSFRPVGWPFEWEVQSPVAIVAATNKDLRQAIKEGKFREDLYHRFRYRLTVPPLRERRGDLRVLIDFVLQDPAINTLRGDGSFEVQEVALSAIEKLENHSFPGNYRELEEILARAVFNAVRAGRQEIVEKDVELAGGR
jgi:hypothetical protein